MRAQAELTGHDDACGGRCRSACPSLRWMKCGEMRAIGEEMETTLLAFGPKGPKFGGIRPFRPSRRNDCQTAGSHVQLT